MAEHPINPMPIAHRRFSTRSDETGTTMPPSPTSTVFGGTISMFPLPPSQHSLPQSVGHPFPPTPAPQRPAQYPTQYPAQYPEQHPRDSISTVSQLSRPSEIRVSFSDVSGLSDTGSTHHHDMYYATHPTYQPDSPAAGPPRLNSIPHQHQRVEQLSGMHRHGQAPPSAGNRV